VNNPPGPGFVYNHATNTWIIRGDEPYTVTSGTGTLPTNGQRGDLLSWDGREWVPISLAEVFGQLGQKSPVPVEAFFINSDVTYVDTRRTFWAKLLEDGVEE
jgi:hypothetical protein